jgi:hypothetical protein
VPWKALCFIAAYPAPDSQCSLLWSNISKKRLSNETMWQYVGIMSGETDDAFLIGSKLLSHAATAEDRPRYVRGRVTEMFPYIYEAAKKMGIRSISRWLKEEGYAISPPTISRALAKSDEHLEALARTVEPHMTLLVEAFALPNYDVFFGPATGKGGLNEFSDAVAKASEDRRASGHEMTDEEFEWKFERGAVAEPCEKFLSQRWFILSEETRKSCRKFFANINPKVMP